LPKLDLSQEIKIQNTYWIKIQKGVVKLILIN